MFTAMAGALPDLCVFDAPASGSPPIEPMAEPNLTAEVRVFEGLPPTPPPAVRWLMETNQGTCEEMVRPETQVVGMTHEDTVMFGAIKTEVNGSHYSLQRDDDSNRIPNTPFSGKKRLAEELCQNVLLKNSDCTHKRQKTATVHTARAERNKVIASMTSLEEEHRKAEEELKEAMKALRELRKQNES